MHYNRDSCHLQVTIRTPHTMGNILRCIYFSSHQCDRLLNHIYIIIMNMAKIIITIIVCRETKKTSMALYRQPLFRFSLFSSFMMRKRLPSSSSFTVKTTWKLSYIQIYILWNVPCSFTTTTATTTTTTTERIIWLLWHHHSLSHYIYIYTMTLLLWLKDIYTDVHCFYMSTIFVNTQNALHPPRLLVGIGIYKL